MALCTQRYSRYQLNDCLHMAEGRQCTTFRSPSMGFPPRQCHFKQSNLATLCNCINLDFRGGNAPSTQSFSYPSVHTWAKNQQLVTTIKGRHDPFRFLCDWYDGSILVSQKSLNQLSPSVSNRKAISSVEV